MGNEITPTEAVARHFGHIHKLVRTRMHLTWKDLGLYRGQNDILFVLWREEGLTQTELALRTMVAPATITNSLQRMERDGWITRRPDTEDQRVSRVYLTDKGRELRQPVRDVLENLENDMLQGFSEQDRKALESYLDRVIKNLIDAHERAEEKA